MRKKFLILICGILLFASCKNKNVIDDKNKFANIYVDLLIEQEKYKGNFEKLKEKRKEIYSKYKITPEEYNSTIEYYNEDSKRWEEFFVLVNNKFTELQKKNSAKE